LRAEDLPDTDLRSVCQRISRALADGAPQQSLATFLAFIDDRSELLLDRGEQGLTIDALIAVFQYRGRWLRPLEAWQPHTRNRHRRLSSLLRHLFARYRVPHFFDSAWFRSDRNAGLYRDWFIHIGSGRNLRTATSPVSLTKKVVHHMLGAPDDYTIEQALRFGQVKALGGDVLLARAVVGSRLGRDLAHDVFWQSVLRFLVDNPMFDRAQVGPLVDYIRHRKFERQVVMIDGERRTLPPAQPNLSMRGRNATALLAQMQAWHTELGRSPADTGLCWKPSGIAPFRIVHGKGDERATWRVVELLSKAELAHEGHIMKHCVASYAPSCARGDSSIWRMTREEADGSVRSMQTIEVARDRAIVQARGRRNILPNAAQANVIQSWARYDGLTLRCYGLSAPAG